MSTRPWFTRLTSAALIVSLLGACGVSGDDEQVGTTTSEIEAQADDQAEADTGPEDEDSDPQDDGDDGRRGSFFGGDDDTNAGSRPSSQELSKALKDEADGAVPDDVAECIGQRLHDSDLPNGVLRAMVEGREAEVDLDNIDHYEAKVTEIGMDCATAALDDLDLEG